MNRVSKNNSAGHIRRTFMVLSLSAVVSCQNPSDTLKTKDLLKTDTFFDNIKEVNGLSGAFEGVYSYPGMEGSEFFFCSKDECPDLSFTQCYPEFSDKAADALAPYLGDDRYNQIRVVASGHIETGTSYGHLGAYICKIVIDDVKDPVPLSDVVYRSKLYPNITSKPSEQDRSSKEATSSR